MSKYKVVFNDGGIQKLLFGTIEIQKFMVKVETDQGNTVFVNKDNIVFMKEIKNEKKFNRQHFEY